MNILIPWNKVAKRIGELIDADRYLNKAEKAAYPAYLAEKEARERRYQFAGRFNSLVDDFNDYETQIDNEETPFELLSPEEKKIKLFLKQKHLLDLFLERNAISREQYDKSLGDLTSKMGMEKYR